MMREESKAPSLSTAAPAQKTFESLISHQHTDGFWPASAEPKLAVFLKDRLSWDGDVMQALESETLNAGFKMD